MITQLTGRVGRRRRMVMLALVAATAGLLWFGVISGAGIASADGGQNTGAQQGNGNVAQFEEDPNLANCLFPGIPC